MKQFFLLIALSAAFFSCNGNKKAEIVENGNMAMSATDGIAVFDLDGLLQVAGQEVDKTVKVVGYVTHTCKHSGKRCFIAGESENASMRVEAKGEIGGFNRELVGSKLEITGILKERRLSKEYLDQMEQNVELKRQEDASAESCAAELSNINDMRRRMKEQDKEYFSIFYMDGLDYTVLD
ncbi:MAG: hypothetical protein LBI65_02830 [Candidatus Symbiothrix sp.]|jgi:hypothetical protein|nr:hypothetical protein [Candidatus Symbiothrix sp.]